jgi:hypothetical protein
VEIRGPGVARELLTPAASESRVWFNPDLRSRNYFVPGVAANILLMVTLMLTSQAIIREKEIGTMEQLMVTPMRPIELMLGKTLPFAMVGMVNLLVIAGRRAADFPRSLSRQFFPAAVLRRAVPDDQPGRGTVSFDHLAHPAAGQHGIVLLHHAGLHVERLHVPHPQHAGGGAISGLFEPAALFHGDRARHLSEGRGRNRVMAANALLTVFGATVLTVQRRASTRLMGRGDFIGAGFLLAGPQDLVRHVRVGPAGRHAIDLHVVAADFLGHALDKAGDRCLGGGIDREIGPGMAGPAADDDDDLAGALLHQREAARRAPSSPLREG